MAKAFLGASGRALVERAGFTSTAKWQGLHRFFFAGLQPHLCMLHNLCGRHSGVLMPKDGAASAVPKAHFLTWINNSWSEPTLFLFILFRNECTARAKTACKYAT
jgi:hypothetical protein